MADELLSCLQQFLSDDQITQIKSGTFTPNPDTAKQMKGCYLKLSRPSQPSGSIKPSTTDAASNKPKVDLSPAMRECILKNYGQGMLDQLQSGSAPTDEVKQKILICLNPSSAPGDMNSSTKQPQPQSGPQPSQQFNQNNTQQPNFEPGSSVPRNQPKEPFFSEPFGRQ